MPFNNFEDPNIQFLMNAGMGLMGSAGPFLDPGQAAMAPSAAMNRASQLYQQAMSGQMQRARVELAQQESQQRQQQFERQQRAYEKLPGALSGVKKPGDMISAFSKDPDLAIFLPDLLKSYFSGYYRASGAMGGLTPEMLNELLKDPTKKEPETKPEEKEGGFGSFIDNLFRPKEKGFGTEDIQKTIKREEVDVQAREARAARSRAFQARTKAAEELVMDFGGPMNRERREALTPEQAKRLAAQIRAAEGTGLDASLRNILVELTKKFGEL